MPSYSEDQPRMSYPLKDENFLPMEDGQRRVFHNGDFQGWEYKKENGSKGLSIFYCFLEEHRVGKYIMCLSSVEMAKDFVAGVQKWIDEKEKID